MNFSSEQDSINPSVFVIGSAATARLTHGANVAVLFARRDSNYKAMAGVDVWDADRDAKNWPGGNQVVAHPPCRAWPSLRHCAKPRAGEKELAIWAVQQIRRWGGVLEHPRRSLLWPTVGLPMPKQRDVFGGFTLIVDQFWWGHRARKRTLLYVCGCEPREVPKMPLALGDAPCTVGLWSGRDKQRCRPSIGKSEYEATPPEFAAWLVALAARCRPNERA